MRALIAVILAAVVLLPARSGEAKPRPAPAAKAGALPQLRTGTRTLADAPGAPTLEVSGRFIDRSEELIALRLTRPDDAALPMRVNAHSARGGAVFAFVGETQVWLRRPAKDEGQAIEGEAFFAVSAAITQPALRWRFSVPGPMTPSDPSFRASYGQGAAAFFRERGDGAFGAFAASRFLDRYAPQPKQAVPPNAPWRGSSPDDIARLMDTTTGMSSVQEALQIDRPLWLRELDDKPTVPLSKLKPPPLASHPFVAMLSALHRAVPEEKLATATPADFYYARINDLGVFFRLADQLDAWATPAVAALDGHAEDHALSERTLTQLGLERSQLARALGTTVIADLAVVGSDPYVREGSDVTVIFRVKQRALFTTALDGALQHHAEAHHALQSSTVSEGGVSIRATWSTDGAVRQQRATVGDLEIVSTSLGAVRRVLAAIAGKAPRLSDEPDFKYMLARDAGQAADALFYLGDRFIGEVVGPRQKVLEARRQEALSELLVPGYAALVYGWVEGHAPASTDALVAAGWLDRRELHHAREGGEIHFVPGAGARSSWGMPSALEPLLDRVAPTLVTKAEEAAYIRFAQAYQYRWRQYIDPVAVRITAKPDGAGTRLVADMRVLPLIQGTDYNDLHEMAGHTTLAVPPTPAGLRMTVGIGAEARVRREASQFIARSPLGDRIAIDWLGDWATIGVEDQVATLRAGLSVDRREFPQAPTGDDDADDRRQEWATFVRTPVYIGLGIKNAMAAALFLTAGKKFAMDAAPGILAWREGPPYKGQHTVHISIASHAIGADMGVERIDVWYALSPDAIFFTLDEGVLHHLIDELKGGRGTRQTKATDAPQVVTEWGSAPAGPLRQLFAYFLEAEAFRSLGESRRRAEAFLRGAPGADLRTVSLAYEGAEPTPPDGGHYTLAADGVRDPARGSAVLDAWPAIPVSGSPVARLLAAVQHFRGELSFDDEPAVNGFPVMRSLHARATLGLVP